MAFSYLVVLTLATTISAQYYNPCQPIQPCLQSNLALSAPLNPGLALPPGLLNPALLQSFLPQYPPSPALPAVLPSCGPPPTPLPPLTFSEVAPLIQSPPVALPSPPLPPPRVVSQICRCQKTVVKPQVFRKITTIPQVQKLIQNSYTPVAEKLNWCASPCCGPELPAPALPAGLPASSLTGLNLELLKLLASLKPGCGC